MFSVNEDSRNTEHYLPDADPDAVGVIITWVYRHGIKIVPGSHSAGLLKKGTDEHAAFTKAISRGIDVYMLAAKFGMVELEDFVMTELGRAYHDYQAFPSPADIAAVYAGTSFSSGLRKYMARAYQILAGIDDGEIATVGWTADDVDDIISKVPALFKDFRALNRKSKGGVDAREPSLDMVCSYHAHGVDEKCASKDLNFRGKLPLIGLVEKIS